MKRILLAAALAASPVMAWGQDFTTYFGFGLVSDYVAGGESQTGGSPAIQPYVELEHSSGLYIGVWGSNVDFAPDTIEIDLYGGWRGEFGGVSVDLGLYEYYYNETGNCDCGEAIAKIGYSFGDMVSANTDLAVAFGGGFAVTQGVSISLPSDFSVSGSFKWRDATYGGFNTWDIGVSKSLNDNVSLDLRYYDSNNNPGIFVVGVSFDFSSTSGFSM